MTALRIAYVIGTTAGGTGRHVAMLAEGCAGRGLTVSVFGPDSTRRLFPAVAFTAVDIAERPRPVRDTAAVLRLRRLLAGCAPDVVHAHGVRAGAAAVLALTGAARRRRPALTGAARGHRPALQVTVHNMAPSGTVSGPVYLGLERLIARRADAVLCVSADLAGRMRRAGARDVALAVVPAPAAPPPSAEAVGKARADMGASGRPIVFAAGRLAPQKGFDVLLEAMTRLQGREPVPLLVIAGDGPMAGQLAARSRATRADVRFLGQRADIPALLAAADVAVVPSRWEGQPLIVQEALRAGRPLIASRVGGIPGLTGEAALLIPANDPVRLASALASVLDEPAQSGRLAEAALARARTLPSQSDAIDAAIAGYAGLAARTGPGSA